MVHKRRTALENRLENHDLENIKLTKHPPENYYLKIDPK